MGVPEWENGLAPFGQGWDRAQTRGCPNGLFFRSPYLGTHLGTHLGTP